LEADCAQDRGLHDVSSGFGLLRYYALRQPELRLSDFFWSVEKDDANPANIGMIGLVKSM